MLHKLLHDPFSFLLTEMQLIPWEEYTYCITANTIHPKQAGPTVKQKSTVELHGMYECATCKRLTVMNQYYAISGEGACKKWRTKVHSYCIIVYRCTLLPSGECLLPSPIYSASYTYSGTPY